MDLAEIRKKAKAQNVAEGSSSRRESNRQTSARRASTIQGVPEEHGHQPPAHSPEKQPLAPPADRQDPLDVLFSECKDLQLATEETYYQGLVGGGGSEDYAEARREWLTFFLGKEEYALDIEGVGEIIKPIGITEIPRAPEYILGIISLRGVVIPIFDLKRRLRLGVTEETSSSRIVVCQQDDRVAGMLVESITQVVRIAERNIEPPPSMLPDLDGDLVKGVGRQQGRLLILLNLTEILISEHVDH